MPPKAIFKLKDRPSGLEFPSCKACNNGTRAADAAIAFYARIEWGMDEVDDWKTKEALKYLNAADSASPGFRDEMFNEARERETFRRTEGGIILPVVEINCEGPFAQGLLAAFGAKLGMALYNEHTSTPLPINGGVHAMWFLNEGPTAEFVDTTLRILPVYDTLTQGQRKSASGQFDYRFNSDDKSIVAALTHFHGNIHFFTIAMATPALFKFPRNGLRGRFVKPGELVDVMPKPKQKSPFILLRP